MNSILSSGMGGAGGLLMFEPKDVQTLYKCYMPFFKFGGIYVPTDKEYVIGSEVFLLANLPEINERLPVVGEVIWINNAKTVIKPAGIGLMFKDTKENALVKDKIEKLIIGIKQDLPTYTM